MGSSTSAGSSLFVGDSKTTQLFPPTGAKTHAAGSVSPATGAWQFAALNLPPGCGPQLGGRGFGCLTAR